MQEKSSSRRAAAPEGNGGLFPTPVAAFAMWEPVLAGAAKWNGKVYEGLAILGSEWLDFVTRRLKEDLRLPQQLCACRSPEEIRDVHVAFWQRAVEDYQKEFTIVANLGNGFVNNSLVAAQNRIEEAEREMSRSFAEAA
jgi:hypothetical protein